MRWRSGLVISLVAALGAAVAPAAAQDAGSTDNPVLEFMPSSSRQPAGSPMQALGTDLGRVRIPAIEMDQEMYAGVDLTVLAQGAGHWVGTAGPGGKGNMVIAGHRTTHGAPFGDLDRLERGDLILFDGPFGTEIMYSVTETLIVTPDAIWITYDNGESMATLFACHPKGSARQRIVVRAKLVGEGRIA